MSKAKKCAISGREFDITDDDVAFYEKIGVPEPALCPDERQRRRYAWRNERILYRRDCDMCKKSTVSLYDKSSDYAVYCPGCWWSDSWDYADYAREIDFTRPFFDQLRELQRAVPRPALFSMNSVDCEYTNHTGFSKNCYMSFVAWESENVMYSYSIVQGKDCVDCYRTEYGANELLYECVNVYRSYKCQYGVQLEDCSECRYCFDCKGSQNCFMSCNLRGASYVFMNEQLEKEEYLEKISEFNFGSHDVRKKLYKNWIDMIQEKALHRPYVIEHSVNVHGNLIFKSKNARNAFEITNQEDVSYIYVAIDAKDSMDCYHYGANGSELGYECHAGAGNYQALSVNLCYDNSYIYYSDVCNNSENLFGCISVKKGSYMILNKKYSKEEYTELKEKLIIHMKETGEYGEFFPIDLSPFAYNETQAQVYMPLSKEYALERGYAWQDDMPGTYGKETIQSEDIPDDIKDVDDSITKEILVCTETGRNYNIVPQELQFYRQNNIPIPRLHPDVRYHRRNSIRPDRKLYDAVCSETGESIQTAWPPERRPKRLVSEAVYKKEIL